MKPADLLQTALRLARGRGRRPRQSDLRRALSTAYYACFHALARECADRLIGGPGAQRSDRAWQQVYRALNHGHIKNVCAPQKLQELGFPDEIREFAEKLVELQKKRHEADYNPLAGPYYRSEVLTDIEAARSAIDGFRRAPMPDRRAFCAYALLPRRA